MKKEFLIPFFFAESLYNNYMNPRKKKKKNFGPENIYFNFFVQKIGKSLLMNWYA